VSARCRSPPLLPLLGWGFAARRCGAAHRIRQLEAHLSRTAVQASAAAARTPLPAPPAPPAAPVPAPDVPRAATPFAAAPGAPSAAGGSVRAGGAPPSSAAVPGASDNQDRGAAGYGAASSEGLLGRAPSGADGGLGGRRGGGPVAGARAAGLAQHSRVAAGLDAAPDQASAQRDRQPGPGSPA